MKAACSTLNIPRPGEGRHGYVGMRELSTNRCPPPAEAYFPDGLRDYKGNPVGDFLQESKASRPRGATSSPCG